ncbi:MAG: pitrilysin family protein, partial [Acidobacteria bacterium]|nr:pitrilysin family protein [Acidobacteriota bacterium]
IVNIQVWYHVGSKDERPGRTGFAHLFEHLMFKGSKNVQPEHHSAIISGVGGQSNAYTNEDVTVFWETVPSHYLPLALWLEADRMATLRFDKAMFNRERDVVKEERRMRTENQPYGRMPEIIYGQAFTVHPYRHPTIGSTGDLESASLDDVREFFRTFYVPTNATVTIAGDMDSAQAVELVTKYFGRIPKPARAVPRDLPVEPPPTGPRHVTIEESWPLPVVVIAHHVTFDGHPDSYPLHVASKILSDGQSSRIYQKLVYETGMALAAFGVCNLVEQPNLFYAVAIVQPGHTPAEAEAALAGELDRLRAEPITEADLSRAKNQFTRDYVLGRETVQQKATVLAHASVLHHNDVSTADGEFEIFQAITVADVQRVAQTYFAPERRLVITVLPKAATGDAR